MTGDRLKANGFTELKQRLKAFYKEFRVNRAPLKRFTLGKIKCKKKLKLKVNASQPRILVEFTFAHKAMFYTKHDFRG